MRALRLWFLVPVLFASACAGRGNKPTRVATSGDLVITNARLLGASGDTVVIEAGRIKAVGPSAAVLPYAKAGSTTLDAAGAHVVPGFHDAHIHMMGGGMGMNQLHLADYGTMDAVVAAVRAYAKAHPEEPWILGRGWQYNIVPKGEFPTRQTLDAIIPDRPVFLRAYDGHAGWANTKALEIAGITAVTPEPEAGRIVREADGKTPSGTLLEDAMGPLFEARPQPSRQTKLDALRAALDHCLELGITSVDDIPADVEAFELYGELERNGELPLRVTVSPPIEGNFDDYVALRAKYQSERLRFGFIKGFVDGVIESKTAYMLEGYTGSPEEKGKPLIPPDQLFAWVKAAHDRDLAVGLHSIGDAGVRLSLDAFEAAQKASPKPQLRHRCEHLETVHPDDLPRFKALGAVASMQPYHAYPGAEPDEGVWSSNLGPERLGRSFPWRSLLDAGAPLAFGSDWPVMSADPLLGLAVATTRQDEEGRPVGGWNKHQAVTMNEAVTAFTSGAAAAVGREHELGKIAPGYLADLVVLQPSVALEDPKTLWSGARIAQVIVDGVVLHDARR